jgi:hypothetical protein
MKNEFKTFILIGLALLTAASLYAQPCAAAGQNVDVVINLPNNLPAGDYQIDLDNGSGTQIPLCFCPVTPDPIFPPPFNTCAGDIVSVQVTSTINGFTNTIPMFPRRARVGCSGAIVTTGVFFTLNGTATSSSVLVRVRIPASTPCNRQGNITLGLFRRFSPTGFASYSNHSGSFRSCAGPALARPTDIYMSSPNTFNCTWNISTYPVPGATSFAWVFTGPISGTLTTTGVTGPALPAGTFQVCVTAQNVANCSVSPQYCELMNIPTVPSLNCQRNGLESPDALALSIVPNPNNGLFQLNCPKEMAGQPFRIFSTDGRMVRAGELVEGQLTLDLTGSDKGLYVLHAAGAALKFILE